jgi:hypothetical protein
MEGSRSLRGIGKGSASKRRAIEAKDRLHVRACLVSRSSCRSDIPVGRSSSAANPSRSTAVGSRTHNLEPSEEPVVVVHLVGRGRPLTGISSLSSRSRWRMPGAPGRRGQAGRSLCGPLLAASLFADLPAALPDDGSATLFGHACRQLGRRQPWFLKPPDVASLPLPGHAAWSPTMLANRTRNSR